MVEADEDGPEQATRRARSRLIELLERAGIDDLAVLDAIAQVPRHELVPDALSAQAYADRALPIGHDQTISQPFIVALMTQLAELAPGARVLEVGTGSGYQAAVLAELGAEVYSIEIVPELAARARERLSTLGYGERVHTRVADGYGGWPEQAPFDAILLTAAPPQIPAPLIEQLTEGGRLVAPVGVGDDQQLVVLRRAGKDVHQERSVPVRFVPMTGRAQR